MFDDTRIARIDLYGRILLGLTALVCALSPVMGGARIDLVGSEHLFALFAVLIGIAYAYRPAGRNIPAFHFNAIMTADLVAYGIVFGLFSYVAAQSPRPLFDAAFVAIDEAMGFDWKAYLAFTKARPWLDWAFRLGYYSMLPQVLFLVIVLSWQRDQQRIRLLMNGILICAIIAIALSALYPAMVAYVHYGMLTPETPRSAGIPMPAYEPYFEMMRIRSGTMKEFSLITTTGIVAFPSFHTMVGVLLAWFMFHITWLRWPGLVLNGLLVAATPVEGGHFLIDAVVGFGVAVAVALALQRYAEVRQSEPVMAANALPQS